MPEISALALATSKIRSGTFTCRTRWFTRPVPLTTLEGDDAKGVGRWSGSVDIFSTPFHLESPCIDLSDVTVVRYLFHFLFCLLSLPVFFLIRWFIFPVLFLFLLCVLVLLGLLLVVFLPLLLLLYSGGQS